MIFSALPPHELAKCRICVQHFLPDMIKKYERTTHLRDNAEPVLRLPEPIAPEPAPATGKSIFLILIEKTLIASFMQSLHKIHINALYKVCINLTLFTQSCATKEFHHFQKQTLN